MKTVSVIVPSYNHSSYICDAVDSIINQDYEGLVEIIVVDDFSSDDTLNVLKKFDNLVSINRAFRLIEKNKNYGINHSIEQGLRLASGDFAQIVASDDVLCEEKIKTQVAFLEVNGHDCVYSRGFFYYEDGATQEFFLPDFKKSYEKGEGFSFVSQQDWGAPLAQSALFRSEILNELVEVRQRFKSDDWAMLIVLFRDYNVGYIDKPLFLYRQHSANSYKNYDYTFPMRVEVISRLVDEKFKARAYSNIFLSQAQYLACDGKKVAAAKFLLCSSFMNLNSNAIVVVVQVLLPRSVFDRLRGLKRVFSN